MKTEIKLCKLKAANIFSSKEETRYYLNGVLIELVDGILNIVATDGNRIIKFSEKTKIKENLRAIIPSSMIEKIKKERGLDMCSVEIWDAERKDGIKGTIQHVTIVYNGAIFTEATVDGTYPDYERVFPKVPEEREVVPFIGFNPSFLGDFAKVNVALGCPKGQGIKMEIFTQDGPCLISGGYMGAEYKAVLMPMRV